MLNSGNPVRSGDPQLITGIIPIENVLLFVYGNGNKAILIPSTPPFVSSGRVEESEARTWWTRAVGQVNSRAPHGAAIRRARTP